MVAIESNDEDGGALHQDQKVSYYLREKKSIQSHILKMVQAGNGNLYSGQTEAEVNVNSDHGDWILF